MSQPIVDKINDIARLLDERIKALRVTGKQIAVNTISEISKHLGLFQNGELRFGNSVEPGRGFTGIRFGFPYFTYSGTSYIFVVIVNDVPQWGITSTGSLTLEISLDGLSDVVIAEPNLNDFLRFDGTWWSDYALFTSDNTWSVGTNTWTGDNNFYGTNTYTGRNKFSTSTEDEMLSVYDAQDELYLGGVTNGIKIEKGGELTLIGTATRWNDLRVEPVVRTTGVKAPTFTAYKTNVYLYDFDDAVLASEKEVFFTVQLPHDWKEGSTIYPHVHWIPRTAGTAGHVALWVMDFTMADIGSAFGATTQISGTTLVGGGAITTADAHLITPLASIGMSGQNISTVLVCRLYRHSSDASDTYTGTAGLLYVDFHYEIDTIGGSKEEYTK